MLATPCGCNPDLRCGNPGQCGQHGALHCHLERLNLVQKGLLPASKFTTQNFKFPSTWVSAAFLGGESMGYLASEINEHNCLIKCKILL